MSQYHNHNYDHMVTIKTAL